MVIGIFGESCTGKSTIADALKGRLNATVYSGKDYLRLSKNESEAAQLFSSMLAEHVQTGDSVIYVISEKQQLSLLPSNAVRVLATAELDVIKERFSKRMNGKLPPPIATMLEQKHGMFDNETYDIHVESTESTPEGICDLIIQSCTQ